MPIKPIKLYVDFHPNFMMDIIENELIAEPRRLPELKMEYIVDLY
jgi:hypothetical protein